MNREEEVIQSKCVIWFWNEFPKARQMLHHNDNNSWNAIIGAKKKALGVVKGVADLELILFGEVVFIEIKTLTGAQSPEQLDFEDRVTERGHEYVIIRSVEEFKTFIWNKMTSTKTKKVNTGK